MIETATACPTYFTDLDQTYARTAFQEEETRLIHQAQKGNLDAFNQLVLSYQDVVYRQAFWVLGEQEAAEDATQEAFIRAFQNIQVVYGSTFKAWLLRITTNVCIDMVRRVQRHPLTALEPVDEDGEEFESAAWMVDRSPSIEATVETEQMVEAVQQCLSRLHPDYRTAIVLVDIQELDYEEAARSMGICMGTFKSRLARARMRLRGLLQDFMAGGINVNDDSLAGALFPNGCKQLQTAC
jgi:RNA polymerase sigma-70 factor (ECF subfamily)